MLPTHFAATDRPTDRRHIPAGRTVTTPPTRSLRRRRGEGDCSPSGSSSDRFVRALEEEWRALDSLGESRDALRLWRARHPAVLAGCRTFDDVLTAIRHDPDPVLLALLELTRSGDLLAGQVVVQAMLPKIVAMARTDRDHEVSDYVGWLWLRIQTYPIERRRQRIAANLSLDTLKQATRARRGPEHPEWGAALAELVRYAWIREGLDRPDKVASLTAARVIRTARQLGLIDRHERQLLHSVYAEGLSGKAVAARFGMSVAMVRWRCSRVVRRLAAHAQELLDAA